MSDPIARVDVIELSIPFEDGGAGEGLTPGRWRSLDQVLVRIETRAGRVGWGEAFGYVCRAAVAATLRQMVAPILIGREPDDPAALNAELQRKLHLFGRYGITVFAISGVDIALWDIKSRTEGVPLHALLGAAQRPDVQAYASLVRYGEAGLVARYAARAWAEGYTSIKLHEITRDCIAAGRAAAGQDAHLTVDVNCAWNGAQAMAMLPELAALDIAWLEEPIFPPEDFSTLAMLEGQGVVAIAAGENACTAFEFTRMAASRAVRFAQPSITKMGGVSEFMAAARVCAAAGIGLMPHSPYFGPGYWATLHAMAVLPGAPLLEILYVDAAGESGLARPHAQGGRVAIPQGVGLGFTPDAAALRRFAV